MGDAVGVVVGEAVGEAMSIQDKSRKILIIIAYLYRNISRNEYLLEMLWESKLEQMMEWSTE